MRSCILTLGRASIAFPARAEAFVEHIANSSLLVSNDF